VREKVEERTLEPIRRLFLRKGEGCMKQALALAVGAAAIICMTYGSLRLSAGERVLVCHREGNGSAHVIEIAEDAVKAHLNHGDSLEGARGLKPHDTCSIIPLVLK